MSELVLRALEEGVLTLTWNRPERHNGWTLELEEAYFDALAAAAADAEVRAIVVTGAGRAFCPGLDVQALAASAGGARVADRPRRPMTFPLSIPKPIIAAINGACAGIGFIQAACADLRFGARGAKLTTAFARRGLPAENSIAWLLPRLIGQANAADLLLSARTIQADEAKELGFLRRVAEPADLLPSALAYAHDLADNVSPVAMATIKAQLWGDWERSQNESRRFALDRVADLSDNHPDFKEGVRSFVEKRPPEFPGLSVDVDVEMEIGAMTEHHVVVTPAEYMESFDPACPQQAYHDLAEASPFTAPDGMPVVTRMAELVALNRHPAVHATDGIHFNLGGKRPLIPLDLDGPEHTRYRRLLDPLFSPKAVARLSDQVRERTNALIDDFAGAGEVELFEAFCVPLPSHIFIRLLGLPLSDLPRFVAFKDATVRPEGNTDEERHDFKARAGETMYTYLQDVLEQRRREPSRDDLIGGFLTTEVDGDRLSDEEIIDICYLLVIAGLDTVTSSLSCLVAWLAQHPDERDRLVAEPSAIPAAIEELMRFESPVLLGHRWIAEDIEVDGRRFEGGTKVTVVWASANVDPDAIADPLTVDLGRTDCRHVSFASGFHRCLGSNLARLELRIALEELHRRLPDYRITPGAEPVYINYGVRAAIQLPLSFTPSP